MGRLSEQEIGNRLEQLDGWTRKGQAIRKDYSFPDFARAIEFVNQVAGIAEEMDHHPDIDIRYDTVVLSLSTHSAGGLTERDFRLAARADAGRT